MGFNAGPFRLPLVPLTDDQLKSVLKTIREAGEYITFAKPGVKSLSAVQELNQLHETIRSCKNCGLHATRTQAVPGVGPCPSNVMIVGEAPGFNEDRQGEPFVGAAGKLLDTLLARIGLGRADVYITNVLSAGRP